MKALAYFLSFVILLPTMLSCVNDTEFISEEDQNSIIIFKEKSNSILNAIYKIENDLKSNRNFIDEIDQATLNYYENLLEYPQGSVSLEDVNFVITQYGISSTEGIQSFLDEQGLSELAKTLSTSLSDGITYNNLYEVPGFNSLDNTEKEILLIANDVIQQRSCGVGAGIGIIIGSWVCQPVCIIVGAIIGCIIGKL